MINILLSRGIIGQEHMIKKLKPFIKANNRILIVALSFFPKFIKNEQEYDLYYNQNSEYYQKMITSFSAYNVKEANIKWLHYYNDSPADALAKIKEADVIYFTGGAPELMMRRINAFGIKKALEAHKKVYIGSSAGAMIQFSNYHISPDIDYPNFSYEQGLNLLDGFSIEVHYRRKKKQKAALRKVHRAFKHDIFAIPDSGAIIINNGQVECLNSAHKIYDKKGIARR